MKEFKILPTKVRTKYSKIDPQKKSVGEVP